MPQDDVPDLPKTRGKRKIVLPLVLFFLAGAVGFAFTFLGLSPSSFFAAKATAKESAAFIELDPMTISITGNTDNRHLRIRAALEVDPAHVETVEKLRPRVMDVMNTYLHSVDLADVENPTALISLRSQIRRRIDLVVGGDMVTDLLVQEFVLN